MTRKDRRFKHGMDRTTEHRAWVRYKKELPHYWQKDFKKFLKDVGFKPDPACVLSRHDRTQPHSKENTYWKNRYEERQQMRDLDHRDEFTIDLDTLMFGNPTAPEGKGST